MKKSIWVICSLAVVLVGLLFFVAPDSVDIPGLTSHSADPKKGLYQQSIKSLWFDYGDIVRAYYHRSGWVEARQFPYSYTDQEYPPLGIAYFSLPRLFTSDLNSYVHAYTLLASVTFFVLLFLMLKLLEISKQPRWYLLFFLLPSFLYFVLSRFDVLAASLVMGAIVLLHGKKFTGSMILVGIAMLIKWYPIFLVPFAIAWAVQQGVTRKQIEKGIMWAAGIFLGVTGITIVMSGVRAGFPYAFHALRGIEMGSLPSVFLKILSAFHVPVQSDVLVIFLGLVLFGAQLLPFFYSVFFYAHMKRRVITFDHVLRFTLLAFMIFVHFGKIYSPQWEIWWLPLALLVVRKRSELFLIIVIDLLNYVLFPLIPVIYNGDWFRYAYFDSIVVMHITLVVLLGLSVATPLFNRKKEIEPQADSSV